LKRTINMKKGIMIVIAAVIIVVTGIEYSGKSKITGSGSGTKTESSNLYVGAGVAEMKFPTDFFSSPVDGYTGVHDQLHVRVLLMEKEAKTAIVSVEMTSISDDVIEDVQNTVGQLTGYDPKNIWVCATHTFSAPHLLPINMYKSESELEKRNELYSVVAESVTEATSDAIKDKTEATVGYETTSCNVNVNRDVLTDNGWWIGHNDSGVSDKSMIVLKFEDLKNKPIAVLFNYGVQSSVMDGVQGSDGSKMVSSDLGGYASNYVEQKYGNGVVAIFGIGAAGDQAPNEVAKNKFTDENGILKSNATYENAYELVKKQGEVLGNSVISASDETKQQSTVGTLSTDSSTIKLPRQERSHDLTPQKVYTYQSAEDQEEPVNVITLGDISLTGIRPELSSQVASSLKEQSPYKQAMIFTLVNGAAKYMPEKESYDRITYESTNTSFARGSAELMQEKILEMLNSMHEK